MRILCSLCKKMSMREELTTRWRILSAGNNCLSLSTYILSFEGIVRYDWMALSITLKLVLLPDEPTIANLQWCPSGLAFIVLKRHVQSLCTVLLSMEGYNKWISVTVGSLSVVEKGEVRWEPYRYSESWKRRHITHKHKWVTLIVSRRLVLYFLFNFLFSLSFVRICLGSDGNGHSSST